MQKWKLAVAVVCLIVLVLGVRAALESRDDRIRLEATSKAEKRYRAELDEQQKANDSQAAADKAAVQKELDGLKTAKQAVKIIREYIPMQVPVELDPTVVGHMNESEPPDAPSATFSQQQLIEVAEFAGKCRQCDIDRSAYMADVSILEKKLKSTERERDAAVTAVHGGTKWDRFAKAAKHIGIGVAVGIAVGAAAKR